MSNEITKIIDTITPKVFNAYMDQYINEHSLLVRSGAVVADERVSRNITAGGLTVNMPFWNDLSGEDQVLSEDKEIETGKITSGKDVAAVLYRGQGWSVNELAGVVSGSDPMRAILDRIGGFWLRQEQKVLMAVLKGLFATSGPLADTHLLDLSKKPGKAAVVDAKAILDAKQLMGDASRKLKILAVHSSVYTKLQKDNLIQYIQATDANIQIPTYLGYTLLVDDELTPEGDVYTSYLLGSGAFGRNTGHPEGLTTFETERKAAAGVDNVYTRRALTMHPYGVRWQDNSIVGLTPSNAELATAENWKKVYEDKNIGIVAIRHKLAFSSEV